MILVASLLFGFLTAGVSRTPVVRTEAIARDLVANFNAGRFQAAVKDFNKDLAALVTPEVLAQQKAQVDQLGGGFMVIDSVKRQTKDGLPMVDLICRYEKMSIAFRVVFDRADKISTVFIDPVPKIDVKLDTASRAFLADFTAGNYPAAVKLFDATMRTQLPADRLAELAASVTARFGTYRSLTSMSQAADDNLTAITMVTAYDRSAVELRLVFNKAGEIAGIRIGPRGTP